MTDAPMGGLTGVHRTAFGAAAMRAAHVLVDDPPDLLDDSFALALTGITADEARVVRAQLVTTSGADMSAMWALRARYAEDRLALARPAVRQYVVLGAGFDSFALRMADSLGDLRVFEVDDPPLQEWKQGRIRQLGLVPPAQLQFVPCDFERTTLADALAASGYDAALPTFVSWLGVTQYLGVDTVTTTLRWAAGHVPGSGIALTYVTPSPRAEGLRKAMAAAGVSFATFFTAEEMGSLLTAAGFASVEHLTEEAAAAYFAGRTDGLGLSALERLVSAQV